MKHYMSYFPDEHECINAILNIHNDGKPIELDPMYSQGEFYRSGEVVKPRHRYDLHADENGFDAINADASDLPISSGVVSSMILDPPFLFGVHGRQEDYELSRRFTIFKNYEDLSRCYQGIIKEAYRVLKKGGLLIFKCQDYTDNKTTMTHCDVYKWATECGFVADDIAILNSKKTAKYNGNLKQRHLRKVHCYYWVFKKR